MEPNVPQNKNIYQLTNYQLQFLASEAARLAIEKYQAKLMQGISTKLFAQIMLIGAVVLAIESKWPK